MKNLLLVRCATNSLLTCVLWIYVFTCILRNLSFVYLAAKLRKITGISIIWSLIYFTLIQMYNPLQLSNLYKKKLSVNQSQISLWFIEKLLKHIKELCFSSNFCESFLVYVQKCDTLIGNAKHFWLIFSSMVFNCLLMFTTLPFLNYYKTTKNVCKSFSEFFTCIIYIKCGITP